MTNYKGIDYVDLHVSVSLHLLKCHDRDSVCLQSINATTAMFGRERFGREYGRGIVTRGSHLQKCSVATLCGSRRSARGGVACRTTISRFSNHRYCVL